MDNCASRGGKIRNVLLPALCAHCMLGPRCFIFLLLIPLCLIRLKNSNPVSKHWCLIGKGVKKCCKPQICCDKNYVYMHRMLRKILNLNLSTIREMAVITKEFILYVCSFLSSAVPSKGPSVWLGLGMNYSMKLYNVLH